MLCPGRFAKELLRAASREGWCRVDGEKEFEQVMEWR